MTAVNQVQQETAATLADAVIQVSKRALEQATTDTLGPLQRKIAELASVLDAQVEELTRQVQLEKMALDKVNQQLAATVATAAAQARTLGEAQRTMDGLHHQLAALSVEWTGTHNAQIQALRELRVVNGELTWLANVHRTQIEECTAVLRPVDAFRGALDSQAVALSELGAALPHRIDASAMQLRGEIAAESARARQASRRTFQLLLISLVVTVLALSLSGAALWRL